MTLSGLGSVFLLTKDAPHLVGELLSETPDKQKLIWSDGTNEIRKRYRSVHSTPVSDFSTEFTFNNFCNVH